MIVLVLDAPLSSSFAISPALRERGTKLPIGLRNRTPLTLDRQNGQGAESCCSRLAHWGLGETKLKIVNTGLATGIAKTGRQYLLVLQPVACTNIVCASRKTS